MVVMRFIKEQTSTVQILTYMAFWPATIWSMCAYPWYPFREADALDADLPSIVS